MCHISQLTKLLMNGYHNNVSMIVYDNYLDFVLIAWTFVLLPLSLEPWWDPKMWNWHTIPFSFLLSVNPDILESIEGSEVDFKPILNFMNLGTN